MDLGDEAGVPAKPATPAQLMLHCPFSWSSRWGCLHRQKPSPPAAPPLLHTHTHTRRSYSPHPPRPPPACPAPHLQHRPVLGHRKSAQEGSQVLQQRALTAAALQHGAAQHDLKQQQVAAAGAINAASTWPLYAPNPAGPHASVGIEQDLRAAHAYQRRPSLAVSSWLYGHTPQLQHHQSNKASPAS